MWHDVRRRFWVEVALAAVSTLFLVVTLVWRDWIEIVFRVDPDQGSGWLEWVIVTVALSLAVTFSIGARREWRRPWQAPLAGKV
jgi:hypothetical protein